TEKSTEDDGGNSLFAAVEYWNLGMIYSAKKNKVCAMRKFDKPA
ncbi:MAG: ATP-binding protein, partial [Spirochaetia bacterium]|nr:ATP-binding protein [Spirochaetia bacterium]